MFLCMVRGCVLTILICMKPSSFPNTTCWRECPFLIVYSCLFIKAWLTIGVWAYFWALCSVPLIYICVFVPLPPCFDYCSFVALSEVWKGYASSFVFYLRIALAILGLLWFHGSFRIICSSSVKNVLGSLIGIPWNL